MPDHLHALEQRYSPEQRLLLHILIRAARDAAEYNYRAKKYEARDLSGFGAESREWLSSESVAPWSFRWVLRHLDLPDEDYLQIAKIMLRLNPSLIR